MEWGKAAACRRGSLIPAATPAFSKRNRTDWCFLRRTFRLQRLRHQRSACLRHTDQVPELLTIRTFFGMGVHLHSHSVSRPIRDLHLVSRRLQRHRLFLAGQLAVHVATLDRDRGLRVHDPARVSLAIQRSTSGAVPRSGIWQGTAGVGESVDARLLCCSNRMCLVALRLWNMAVLCEVGNYTRRTGAPQVRRGLFRHWLAVCNCGTRNCEGIRCAEGPVMEPRWHGSGDRKTSGSGTGKVTSQARICNRDTETRSHPRNGMTDRDLAPLESIPRYPIAQLPIVLRVAREFVVKRSSILDRELNGES